MACSRCGAKEMNYFKVVGLGAGRQDGKDKIVARSEFFLFERDDLASGQQALALAKMMQAVLVGPLGGPGKISIWHPEPWASDVPGIGV